MNLGLKQFIEYYDVFCKDDFDIIVKWAAYNNCQPELISAIAALATSITEEKRAFEWQVKEWSNYAMNLVPEINEDTEFKTCINALRLAYFAYDGYQYINVVDQILKSKNIEWAVVEEMHPMIVMKYNQLKEEYVENAQN